MSQYSSSPGYVTFDDGPAAGKRFYVQRAPVFLRVVEDTKGHWDVLDLLEDKPRHEEEIYIYRQRNWVHVRASSRRHSGVYYTYVQVPIQNELKATLRYNHRWQQWAQLAQVAS